MHIIDNAGVFTDPGDDPNHYVEHFRSADLSVGTYSIPVIGTDDQTPHSEDEIYVVYAGAATVVTPSGAERVRPGSVIFVPAGEDHRFEDISADLAMLVVFAPPYESRRI